MEELEVIDINHMCNQLQEQAQLIEHSRINLREQYRTLEQLLLEINIRNPLEEPMQLFEHLYIKFQEQLRAIEQLLLKTEALSPTQLKQQASQLKLELEQLEKLALQLYRLKNRLSMPLITLMLVQLPIHMLLSLILLPLLIRASKSLPEEATADLASFRQRLKRSKKNPIYIQLRTAWHFLEILWAFYIKIKIDNLWLPKKSSTKQGMDVVAPDSVTSLGDIKAENVTVMRGGFRFGGSMKSTPNNE